MCSDEADWKLLKLVTAELVIILSLASEYAAGFNNVH
jgi:hypothetical protein